MPNTINNTSTQGLSDGFQQYMDRKLLTTIEQNFVHAQFAQQRILPKNAGGMTIQFRRWLNPGPSTTPLTEGVPPTGIAMGQADVTATLNQYGEVIYMTDKLAATHFDKVATEASSQVSYNGALSMDTVVREVINAGTNVIYAGGKAARNTLTSSDLITGAEIRQAVRMLKKAMGRTTSGGYYACIIGPDLSYALQEDEDWVKVSHYQDKENIYTGEVGRMWGCRFIETPNAKVFTGGGAAKDAQNASAGNHDVASALVIAQESYGIVKLNGDGVHIIAQPPGSAGTADPLKQMFSVGWKVEGFAAKILNQDWIVRIESGVAA